MRASVFATLFLALAYTATAQVAFLESGRPLSSESSTGLLAASPTRTIVDLNGTWQYKSEDDGTWRSVRVPSSCTEIVPLTFRRDFDVSSTLAHKAVFQLVAVSISYYCEIRINDKFIGKHAGETTFSFKIGPGIIKPGRNNIVISVSPSLNAQETLPLREQLWNRFHYGGILQDIALVGNGAVWVQETEVLTSLSGEGKAASITYKALLNSGPLPIHRGDSSESAGYGKSTVEHIVEVIDAQSGSLVYRSEARRIDIEQDRLVPVTTTLTIPAARLWSPETPSVYTLVQRTYRGSELLDESYTHVGLRRFEVDGARFLLNGAPVLLKGITYLENSPIRGRSLTMDDIERDVLIMKNLGVNAVRVVSGTVHPFFLSLCDKYGLLVFQDLPVYGVPSSILERRAFQASARNMLREIIVRDAAHPCIVAYGLAQGIDGAHTGFAPYGAALLQSLRGTNGQLTYMSFIRPPLTGLPDGLSFASYDLLPAPVEKTREVLNDLQRVTESGLLLLSSLSYPVEVGNYNGYSDPRSIDAQAQYYLEIFAETMNRKLAGLFVHSFADWQLRHPVMSVDRVQQFTGTAGILDAYRQKRLAYEVLKARFNNEKPPVLMVGNYTPEHPASFVVVGILLILIFAIVYNVFRRFRENVVRAFMRPFNFFSDVRDQRMLSIFQTSVVGIIGSFGSALLCANLMYSWRTNIFADALIHQVVRTIWLKQWLNYAAWNPLSNLLVTGVILFLLLLIYAVLLRVAAFFMKRTITLFDSYSVSMWSVLPIIMLAPLGLILYRLMESPVLEFLALASNIVFHLWIFSRLLKGTAIVLDVRPGFFYIGGYAVAAAAVVFWILSLNAEYETLAYLRYLAHAWWYMQGIPAS